MNRRILITQRLSRCIDPPETREVLDVRWGELLATAGFSAVPAMSAQDPAALVDIVHGVILSGGNDLGAISGDELDRRRDVFEAHVLDLAQQRDLPVLGVCRGLQVLAHRAGGSITRVSGHVAARHALAVDAASRWLARHDGKEVNSFHAFGLADAGQGLRAVARAADGTIEAVEHERRRILGIMWHPERVAPFDRDDVAMLREFFA